MRLIDGLMSVMGVGRAVRSYGIADLVSASCRYVRHIEHAIWSVRPSFTPGRTPSDVTAECDEVGRVRFTYLNTYRSWMEGEFIPKIAEYSRPPFNADASALLARSRTEACRCACDSVRGDLEAAMALHGDIVSALHFFLCDERTPFDMKRSMGGDATTGDISSWYVGGKRIVEKNMDRMENALLKFVSPA